MSDPTNTSDADAAPAAPAAYPHDKVGLVKITRRSGWAFTVEAKPSTIAEALAIAEKAHPGVFRDDQVSAEFGYVDATKTLFTPDASIPIDLAALGYHNRKQG